MRWHIRDTALGLHPFCPSASALDTNGEELYPRKWNHDFIDLPVIAKQYRPMFSTGTVSSIVEKSNGQLKVLYALLAGSGLRVGEALGLEIKHVSTDGRTLSIEQSGRMLSDK